MDSSRRGAWIMNITKHLNAFGEDEPRLVHVENLQFAGRTGLLLVMLSGDSSARLDMKRVRMHARVAGISAAALRTHLQLLQSHGCVDLDAAWTELQVLAHSRTRILQLIDQVAQASALGSSKAESLLPETLEWVRQRPRTRGELSAFLEAKLEAPTEVPLALSNLEHLDLVGVSHVVRGKTSVDDIFYNEYQFNGRIDEYRVVLSSLTGEEQDRLHTLIENVAENPAISEQRQAVSPHLAQLAVDLGLLERSTVSSPNGAATFLTAPKWSTPTVGSTGADEDDLVKDVFHQAKQFLCAWKYGQGFSNTGRGRIDFPVILMEKLLRNREIGPCTAIGQDYTMLEQSGVIETVESSFRPGQYHMRLRRAEPVEIVHKLITGTSSNMAEMEIPALLCKAVTFRPPEDSVRAARKATQDAASVSAVLQRIRSTRTTGRR